MKKFNQISEKQMSKINGGIFTAIIMGTILAATAGGTIGAIEASKK